MSTENLAGRVVVITGAGSCIGRELAVRCARRGARLAICDMNPAGLAQTVEDTRAAGSEVFSQSVDVSDAEQMISFAKEVADRLGVVDLLINNAGIAVMGGILETTLPVWDRLIGVNLMGVVHTNAAFLPAMVQRGTGHIVNVASAAGMLANLQLAAYSTTKFAVFGMSQALRMELKPHGISVTAVCPGINNTVSARTSPCRGSNEDARRAKTYTAHAKRGYTAELAARNILRAVDCD
jgi:NAD(P)-dependent dehydrogenase (short-subunit alcohol dehydrogenase family)